MSPDARERKRLFGLDVEVLAHSPRGDGRHWVVKVERDGAREPFILKLYGRKRDVLRDLLRHLGHRLLVGKSGMTPRARMRTERATLALWRKHGFDVPQLLDPPLPPEVPPLHLAIEWIDGQRLDGLLPDPTIPVSDKRRWIQGCAREWSRRHELALRLREPALVHSHAFFGHVLVAGDRLVNFDFEVVWTRRDVATLVDLELAGFLRSLRGVTFPHELDELQGALAATYVPRERFERAAAAGERKSGRSWLAWMSWSRRSAP